MSPWGFVDQAIVSSANFGTTVLLARQLPFAEFGAFALMFSFLLIVVAFQAALISQPHGVLGAVLAGKEFRLYTTSVAWLQVALSGTLLAAWLGFSAVAFSLGAGFAPLTLAFAPLLVTWTAQEFVRRAFFTNGRLTAAIGNDLVSYGGQLVLLLVLSWSGRLTLPSAIAAISVSSLVAYIMGLIHLQCWRPSPGVRSRIRTTAIDHWRFGRWLLGSSMAAWNAGGWYVVLLMIGGRAAAAFRGMEVLMGPIQVLMAGLDSLIPPHAARMYASGDVHGLIRHLGRVYTFTLPIVTGYLLGISIFGEVIIGYILGPEFQQYYWLMLLIAVYTQLAFLHQPVALTLRATGHTFAIFRGQIAAAVIATPIGILVGITSGVIGAAIGLIAHYLVLNAVLWPSLGQVARHHIDATRAGGDGQPHQRRWIPLLQARRIHDLVDRLLPVGGRQ